MVSASTGLDRVGLKRNTSIIEKLTNLTYTTMEREEDAQLIDCLAQSQPNQDISPGDSNNENGQGDRASPSKRKRNNKRRKVATNTSSSAYGESDQSPTLDIRSAQNSQSDSSSRNSSRLVVDKSRQINQIIELYGLKPTY